MTQENKDVTILPEVEAVIDAWIESRPSSYIQPEPVEKSTQSKEDNLPF